MLEKPDCLFCQIIKDKENLIYQDKNTAAFLDIFPVEKAHILVVPKKHSDTWLATDEGDLIATNITAQKLAKKLLKVFPNKIQGFNIVINNGKIANQVVFHFHIHVIPKFNANQGFEIIHKENDAEMKELEITRKILKENLNERGN
ncbi:MAG: HIT family protein [Spiroplasma sp.]|nr:HIT family protein [Spiroplasma sp.]